ncbi:magnesium-transporting ATPase (P-type) [Parabacteroides sp. PF5-5]|uniref:DUF4293 domain-containing protein n=1 Tax=unclassified Parabacteroides TaxID=2649774 RepID=UPI0024749681|nr:MULTISPECIES: DUF4293 domain-containing protein [unclassified Parabacteroides]MDH6304466.1 magnesium-transporting ATPase (P-type) [Parabacteroides sp. PH5-39]MDH6315381.1 magnesium-transporting ATPase (P-type) [Parabacteroides sp. PF5-13]MDH6319125.1 magnesium-transporting ATPase (P-type) [Parabacteroides sp. PH5-13]MDH6322855.1 magnesium-transporting ATPase (P-type) [Parabacteroides sp. PH5-8]MDH6326573.1 magnesium-transporting ATPase (P-type) [Parabacteroides sp. PH5-41]
MLQRIQTVYLLIITVLTVIMLFMPLAVLQTGEKFYSFDVFGVNLMGTESELVYPTWGLFVLTALIAVLALLTIFLYKKRMLQIRVCIFNAILMLGFYGFFAYLIFIMKQQLGDLSVNVKIALAFPIINLILNYLAIRNIGADEMLVRSLDRLR